MPPPMLTTKLYIPRLRPNVVSRPRLIERLNEGLQRKLTLISAPAGFGKTTLVSEWVEGIERPVAWLSLDKGENDPTRFLTYLVAALQTIAAHRSGRTCPRVGSGVAYMSGCPHTRLSRTARKQSIKPKREHCSSLTTPTKQHPNQHFRVSTCRPSWSYATGRSSKWDRRR